MMRTDAGEPDGVVRSIERLRAKAGHLHQELLSLRESATFDPRLPSLEDRAARIEAEARSLTGEAEELRERLRSVRRGH